MKNRASMISKFMERLRNTYQPKYLIALSAAILLCISFIGCTKQSDPTAKAIAPVDSRTKKAKYKIMRVWKIPNGGYGQVLLVDPCMRNENDLKTLGETIREVTRNDRNSIVLVYDDIKAAAMQRKEMNLSKADAAFYDKHFIASYTRNVNTGFHQFVIMVDGVNGNIITINY